MCLEVPSHSPFTGFIDPTALCPLAKADNNIICLLLDFDPDCALILRVASRGLNHKTSFFLGWHRNKVIRVGKEIDSPLMRHIRETLIHSSLFFFLSLPKAVQALEEKCPNKILSESEIVTLSDKIHNRNLCRIWAPLREAILQISHPPETLPPPGAQAEMIRPWINGNLSVLHRISDLQLEELNLSSVPLEISLCVNLRVLDLGSNRLSTFPEGFFRKFSQLQSLHLDNNCIQFLPPDIFQGMGRLTVLDLEHNQIESLPEEVFHPLKMLETLYLHHNHLTSLPERVFQSPRRLTLLNLSHNLLHSLPKTLFRGLSHLETLFLQKNHLVSLPQELLEGLFDLHTLFLHGNPGLMVSLHDWKRGSNCLEITPLLKEFYNYRCHSDFAGFYQRVALGISPGEIAIHYDGMNRALKNALLNALSIEAGDSGTADLSQGKQNIPVLMAALKRMVQKRMQNLNPDQKKRLFSSIPGGERAIRKNILPLIDALEALLPLDGGSLGV